MVLVVCVACDRFVRASEHCCPFCGANRTPTHSIDVVAPRTGAPRLSRAALLLAGTAAVTACGKTTGTDTLDSGRAPDVYVPAPPYGQPNIPEVEPEPPPPPPLDAGRKIHAPPYGMPPPRRDAGKRRPGDPVD
jgi:hypothetical protein